MSRVPNFTGKELSTADYRKLLRRVRSKKDKIPLTREQITLTSGQKEVSFSLIGSDGASFFIIGLDADQQKLGPDQYSVKSENTIELVESYPAGTIVLGEILP